jgi:limonene-1,2-epoxide hydrolase
MKSNEQALKDTDPQKRIPLRQGSAEEERAIAQFRDFYAVFSADTIRASIRTLYAQDAYFRDGFRAVQGIDNLEKYFLSTTEAFEECTFDIQDVAVHEGNYYFRWIMTLALKRKKDDRFQVVGMSHVRFDNAGKITFHQDYWDTGIIYEKIPILGTIITWIRQRI